MKGDVRDSWADGRNVERGFPYIFSTLVLNTVLEFWNGLNASSMLNWPFLSTLYGEWGEGRWVEGGEVGF